jgi:hypothetical protein
MGMVEWFLGIHFAWSITSTSVSVHLNQSGFASNLVKCFFQDSCNVTLMAMPYRSGIPIDAIAPSTDDDDSPAQLCQMAAYQSLIVSIGWLSSSTQPDLAAVHSFLASYSNKPSVGHMKAALYVLHYIHSTHGYGISYTSDSVAPMHCYIHFPPSTDVEAYTDALPPKSSNSSTLSSYSDACWGSQVGSAVADGTLLPLFKFRSMSGGIVFRTGGPVGWLAECQERTSLSSCEAEICATNATSKKVVDFRNICQSMVESGHDLSNVLSPILFYNDNDACVKWSYNMTSKADCHIELHKNSVCKWIHAKLLAVKHVSGKINSLDIFTKEMHDGMHFCRLRDSFMSCLSDFVNASLLKVHHTCQADGASFLLCSSCFFFLLPISSCYISPFQCWLSASSKSSRFCSLGFHIALASLGVFLWIFLFFFSLWFLFPTLIGNPLSLGVVLLLGCTDGRCSVCP